MNFTTVTVSDVDSNDDSLPRTPPDNSDQSSDLNETDSGASSEESDEEKTETDDSGSGDDGEPPVRYLQINEAKRRLTIAYQLYDDTSYSPKLGKNLKFAASIFRPDDPRDMSGHNAANHRATALARLESRPLWAEFGIISFLRRQIHVRGVRGQGSRRVRRNW